MTIIKIANFRGKLPRVSNKLLPDNFSQICMNVDLRQGKIQPIPETALQGEGAILKATPAGIFKLGTKWDSFTAVSNVVRSWIYDTNQRFYLTNGTDKPKQTKLDIVNDCLASASASTFYDLGVAAPATGPSLTIQYNGGSPGDDIQATVNYVYTYVTSWGEESAPSPASGITEVYTNGYVQVSCPTPTSERGASTLITKIRIYRLAVGSAGAEYQYLTEITISTTTTTFDDREGSTYAMIPGADLGEILSTENYDPPPAAMKGLISFSMGLMAGFLSNKLYINEPFIPYAFPDRFKKEVESDIVALGHYGTTLVVTTKTRPYVVLGSSGDPASMAPEGLSVPQGNVAARGTISTEYGVLYPSPDGLVLVNDAGAKVLTENVITKEQWGAYTLASIVAFFHDNKYYAFFLNTNDGFIFDFKNDDLQFIDFDLNQYPATYNLQFKDGYVDPETDILYILVYSANRNYYLLKFGKHATAKLPYEWKSKNFYYPRPLNFTCGMIEGATGTVTFKLYADSVLKQTKTVTIGRPFRCPAGFLANEWEIDITGSIDLDAIMLATSMEEILNEMQG